MISCGIDIGTTTLSFVLCDTDMGEQIGSFTREHKANIVSENSYEHIQDADMIVKLCIELLEKITAEYKIEAIGLTGQMHGILYTDSEGRACSPLYTWQDARGDICDTGLSYCRRIKELTGYKAASGFGLVTHYYNLCNSLVPEKAVSFCSVMDYLGMRLCKRKRALCHPSVAASFGLYNAQAGNFDLSALEKLGICADILPGLMTDDPFIGEYKGAPVTAALGDNQASVFGSVRDEEKSVLVNYGTGSQVSVITDKKSAASPLELRPYIGEKNIICGCALCGGYAYELLENFFRSYSRALGIDKNQYPVMDELAQRAYSNRNDSPMQVRPLFKGTREEPELRASVNGISADNFDAGGFILGTVEGMAEELYDMYEQSGIEGKSVLVASGNGVRKNRILQSLLKEKFDMELFLLENREEAATGAAMYAALCMGEELSKVKKVIRYCDNFDIYE